MSAMASRSSTMPSRTSGRCTFTATRPPLRSSARCTWPSDAEASGLSSKKAKAFEIRTPSSSVTACSTLGERDRLRLVLQARQSFQVLGRKEVGSRRKKLADLDEGRAHGLEIVGELLRFGGRFAAGAIGRGGRGDRGARGRLLVFDPFEPGALDQVLASVFHQQAADVAVTLEARGIHGHWHASRPTQGTCR